MTAMLWHLFRKPYRAVFPEQAATLTLPPDPAGLPIPYGVY